MLITSIQYNTVLNFSESSILRSIQVFKHCLTWTIAWWSHPFTKITLFLTSPISSILRNILYMSFLFLQVQTSCFFFFLSKNCIYLRCTTWWYDIISPPYPQVPHLWIQLNTENIPKKILHKVPKRKAWIGPTEATIYTAFTLYLQLFI